MSDYRRPYDADNPFYEPRGGPGSMDPPPPPPPPPPVVYMPPDFITALPPAPVVNRPPAAPTPPPPPPPVVNMPPDIIAAPPPPPVFNRPPDIITGARPRSLPPIPHAQRDPSNLPSPPAATGYTAPPVKAEVESLLN